MSELPLRKTFEVVCPHCRKPFAGELLAGAADRYRGFKCPHCRLFVPFERVDEQVPGDAVEPA